MLFCIKIMVWSLRMVFNEFDISITFDRKTVIFGKFSKSYQNKPHNLIGLLLSKIFLRTNIIMIHTWISMYSSKANHYKDNFIRKKMHLKNCRYFDYERHWQTICEKCNIMKLNFELYPLPHSSLQSHLSFFFLKKTHMIIASVFVIFS